ncbi:NAD(P)H-dependent oxidoreductase [Paraclostridium bifermentans]|nr:NAD(P)H-dependent oxidoreductase [Paraclostridium bifermentans]
MKTLVIIAHPNMDGSKVNKTWKNHLESSENITINEIYKSYPDGKIDVKENKN